MLFQSMIPIWFIQLRGIKYQRFDERWKWEKRTSELKIKATATATKKEMQITEQNEWIRHCAFFIYFSFFFSFCWLLPLLSIYALLSKEPLRVGYSNIEEQQQQMKYNKKQKPRTNSAMTFYHSCGYMHTDLP